MEIRTVGCPYGTLGRIRSVRAVVPSYLLSQIGFVSSHYERAVSDENGVAGGHIVPSLFGDDR